MIDAQYFHFTLGPVQSFVAQARRTRDFWAGSFLLSWLSAVAMREVEAQGGKIVFPGLDLAFRDALTGGAKQRGPQQGSVPNRFKAQVGPGFAPEQVDVAVWMAWKALAELVWREDLAELVGKIDDGSKSKTGRPKIERLWRNQIGGFWEMTWCLTGDPLESDLLDRRKNWRTYLPPPQSGAKCAVMEGWQELSGAKPPPKSKDGLEQAAAERERPDFWARVRAHLRTSDLRDDERLCAIAFVKRRFHRHFHRLQGVTMPGGWTLYGWRIETGVPSVGFMAAVPWLADLIADHDKVADGVLEALYENGLALAGDHDEWRTRIRCVESALDSRPGSKAWELARLDGSVFFPDLYGSQFKGKGDAEKNAMREALARLGRGTPPPFYALLLMDGDNLGKSLSNGVPETGDPKTRRQAAEKRERLIALALEKFTARVSGSNKPVDTVALPDKGTVDLHDGFLVYAGGDDVLALLPVRSALECARKLRQDYLECFGEAHRVLGIDPAKRIPCSISAAIQFVHVHCPLTRVLRDAHHLLDEIAKDGCGRDALAVRVVKPGGATLEWAMPWETALTRDEQGEESLVVGHMARRFAQEQAQATGLSSKFLFGMRDIFDLLTEPPDPDGPDCPKRADLGLDDRAIVDLLMADYLASGGNTALRGDGEARPAIRAAIEALFRQCQPQTRGPEGGLIDIGSPRADAALLVRFLASQGAAA
ncbi:CRISPR-associated protein Cmr2 [Methylomagnum ishizawai]|uniref:CRISPR-associated protein Cmr2 n=1 Tax=Methylomagnum ishizawai TaxID=1760988 RepID=A0A1Y6CYC7_9GAMM|nr:type III-B CRISPR-associated protein Cas10/Cmr2 [Methylomagnum ishizawai]SMF95240.1 CRISPR-associated protein Cmr2 [Methylomagnum ishizawai]